MIVCSLCQNAVSVSACMFYAECIKMKQSTTHSPCNFVILYVINKHSSDLRSPAQISRKMKRNWREFGMINNDTISKVFDVLLAKKFSNLEHPPLFSYMSFEANTDGHFILSFPAVMTGGCMEAGFLAHVIRRFVKRWHSSPYRNKTIYSDCAVICRIHLDACDTIFYAIQTLTI